MADRTPASHLRPVPSPHRQLLRLPAWRLPPWASFWLIVALAFLVGGLLGAAVRQPTVDRLGEQVIACDHAAGAWRAYAEVVQVIGDASGNTIAAESLKASRLAQAQDAWVGCLRR